MSACWHCWHAALWVVSINVFRSFRALEYETEDLRTERIARGLRSVTLRAMHSVTALVIPRPLSAGADPVGGRNPESLRSRILVFLLPPVFAFPPPHVHAALPLHVRASPPLRVRVPPPLLPLRAPLPGVARALAPILRVLCGGPRICRRV